MNNSLFLNSPSFYNLLYHLVIILLVVFVISLILFFITRWLLLWYWKINKIVELLEKINVNTQVIAKNTYKEAEQDLSFDIKIVIEQCCQSPVFFEIKIYRLSIVSSAELFHQPCLACLSCASYNKRFSRRRVFPGNKIS